MESLSLKTVHASVRPPRVAILVDKSDEDWQNTCLRIIEFYSRLWGGAYNIIIPTDGATIDERFWTILETFDPDYLFRYQKCGEDLYLSHPERYDEILQSHVDGAVREGAYLDAAAAKAHIDKHLRNEWISHLQIAPRLQEEIKARLAPFWFEAYAVDAGAISAGSTPDFHLTELTTIILNTEHPNTISVVEVSEDFVPKLWFGAVTGLFSSAAIKSFEHLGIRCERFSFREDSVSALIELTVTGDIRAAQAARPDSTVFNALAGSIPFNLSMLQLGLYRSTHYQYWLEPLVVVVGNTFEDFCLYYCLSRLRDRVVWMLPSITEKALGSNPDSPISRSEMSFMFQVRNAEMSHKFEGGTASVTYSLTSDQIDKVIQQLSRVGARQYAGEVRKITDIRPLIGFPLAAVERDNFQRDVSVQLAEDTSVSPFNTPKPKHFEPIHPYKHRYITQLSVVGEAPPKHYNLGTWTISDRRLTTGEARIGREGPAYFCPNVGYFGGDIDTVLVRPRLHLAPLLSILKKLALDKGYECRPSDKGIFADASISKWGGLEEIGAFLRSGPYRSLMSKFLDTSESANGEGVYLDDHRRYLDFAAIKAIVGNAATSLIDELISKEVLYRGFIFLCSYCRNADWFSIGDITQEFKCRRCGRRQVYTTRNWKQPEEPAWFYKLDELIYLGYRHGMVVSLLALDYIRKKSEQSFTFTTDCEFWKPKASKPGVEADLFCVPDGVLTVGEAKKENALGDSTSAETAKIRKYKHLVTGLSAKQVVFATLREDWQQRTVDAVREAFIDAPSVRLLFLDASHLLSSQ
jgi:hypothetical protein